MWLFVFILFAGLILRALILPMRWINADEGAHLMDARLLLQGLVPVVDYASRQPFYTLLLAGFLKLFGISLAAGRWLPLLSSLGIAGMLFMLGRRLVDARVGLLAGAIYLLLPYSLIWSTVVKTEMPAVFLCLVAALFLLCGLGSKEGERQAMLFSGFIAGIATFIRQPALYLSVATVLFLLIRHPHEGRWRRISLFALGFVAACAVVALYYGRYMSLNEMAFSQLNPLNLIWSRIGHVLGLLPEQMRIVDSEGFRIFEQDSFYVLKAWRESILFSLVVLTAALMLGLQWWRRHAGSRWSAARKNPLLLFAIWFFLGLAAYGFQTYSSTYYSQYFLELLPTLILPAAVFAHRLLNTLRWKTITVFLVFWPVFYLVFGLFRHFWVWQWPVAAHFGMALLALAASQILPKIIALKPGWLLPAAGAIVSIMLVSWLQTHAPVLLYIVIGLCSIWLYRFHFAHASQAAWATLFFAAMITASYSGAVIGPQYESSWSPATLEGVVKVLHQQGREQDRVLSGAMIWTFSSGLQPFSGVTHPTVFLKKLDARFEEKFIEARPAFIVVDGYTQKKYSRYWPFIQQELRGHYDQVGEVGGSRWPVTIYHRTESPELGESPMAFLPDSGGRR
jgi:hypothetical protein